MISKVINRLVFGGAIGVTVGFLIALGTSLAYQSDTFMPLVRRLLVGSVRTLRRP